MLNRHLTIQEIQELAINRDACDTELLVHADSCPACRQEIALYAQLFTSIQDDEDPVLDFDLSEAILSKIENPGVSKQHDTLLWVSIGAVLAAMTVAVIYLFGDEIRSLFTDLASYMVYSAVIIAGVLVAAIAADMYGQFRKKIKSLEW